MVTDNPESSQSGILSNILSLGLWTYVLLTGTNLILAVAHYHWTHASQAVVTGLAGGVMLLGHRWLAAGHIARVRRLALSTAIIVNTWFVLTLPPTLFLLAFIGYPLIIAVAALFSTSRATWRWGVMSLGLYLPTVWLRNGLPPNTLDYATAQPAILYLLPVVIIFFFTASFVGVSNHLRRTYRESELSREALARSSVQLQYQANLLENVSDAVISTDLNFNIQSWNAAATAIYGWEAEEVLGRSVAEVLRTRYLGDDAATTARQKLLTDGWWKGEVIQSGKTRSTIDVMSSVTRFTDGQGQPAGVVAVNRDITDLKEAAAAKKVDDARYRELFHQAERQAAELRLLNEAHHALARDLDLPTILHAAVEAMRRLLGYTHVCLYLLEGDALILQDQHGYETLPTRLPADQGEMGEVVQTGRSRWLGRPSEQSESDVDSTICVPLVDRGQVVGVLKVASNTDVRLEERDLSVVEAMGHFLNLALERAALYSTVQESERRFRALIENSRDSIAVVSRDGVLLYASRATSSISGLSLVERLGMNSIDAIIHPDDKQLSLDTLGQVLRQPSHMATVVVRVRHKDGSWRWVEASVRNFQDDPAIGGIVVNYHDVTERIQAEEALRQAEKLKSLGLMSGGIAHDFNNLLTVILTQLSLAQARIPEATNHGHLEKARQAAERAAQLTNQLLAHAGSIQSETRPVDLNAVVQENLNSVAQTLPKNIRLVANLTADLPPVAGDEGQLQPVVTNLVINAVEALDKRDGLVRVSTGTQMVTPEEAALSQYLDKPLKPGLYATLTVEDDGPGMDRETLSKIFDPFFTTKFTGRGLGLAVVLGLVRAQGGGLQVESRVGIGTKFKLVLPISRDALSTKELPPATTPPKGLPVGRVLVIDDEESVREAIAEILELEGIDTLAARGGEEGLRLVEEHQGAIKLVLLDLSMPGMNGEETLVRLRQIRPNLPIILTSGYSPTEVHTRFQAGQVAAFLQKPFQFEELVGVVRQHL